MTNKEMLTAIINGAEITDEIKAKATEMLNAIDRKSAKRSEKSDSNRTANIAIAETIVSAMDSGRTYGASELNALMDGAYTTAKITAVMKVAVEDGLVTVVDGYKVGGKGRAVKGYTKTADSDTAED